MSKPDLVSIIIPAWKATWFDAALESALQQDCPACEIIIGDDSQSDDIAQIVERLRPAARWPVYYQRNTPSLGEMRNCAESLAKAQGKYIKFLHDDDLLKPDCISLLVQAIQQHPDIVMATSHREFIDVQGNPLPANECNTPLFNDDCVLYGPDVINFQAETPLNFIGEPSMVLIRADALRASLGAGERLDTLAGEPMPFLANLAMYLKVLRAGHLAFVCQTLSQYRISCSQTLAAARHHRETVSNTHKSVPLMIKKLGWYDADRPKGSLRVASLSDPESFREKNLYGEIAASLYQSQCRLWLSHRQPQPHQQPLAQLFFAGQGRETVCTLYIDVRQRPQQAWERTCNSLKVTTPGLRWQIVALVDRSVDFLPVTVEQIRLDKGDGLDAINGHCRRAKSDWLLFLDAGCELLPSGLSALAFALHDAEGCEAIYTDLIYPIRDKAAGLLFRPDFNLDFYLSSPSHMARYWLYRREWVVLSGGLDADWPTCVELALGLRLIESAGINAIGHLPEPLVQNAALLPPHPDEQRLLLSHLHRRGYANAEVAPGQHGLWRLRYHHDARPLVTIVVLAKGFDSLSRCVLALLENTAYAHFELLIVADRRDDTERERWLEEIARLAPDQIRILHYPHRWHRAAMANAAILQARGEYLLFMHGDIQVSERDWLENMLNHAQRPEVAIVGGKQLYANNAVRHAGYLLGMQGEIAGEPFYGKDDSRAGYMNRLHADQNYSAVSGDFMLVNKEVCITANGFDADLPRYDDVDFCLRVAELGGLTVWTPYARCYRHPDSEEPALTAACREAETDTLFARWLASLGQDRAYNRNFSLAAYFALPADAQQSRLPLAWRPLPVVMQVMSEQSRENDWRAVMPFNRLRREGMIDGIMSYALPTLPEIARYHPDVIVTEPRTSADYTRWLRQLKQFSPAVTIAILAAPLIDEALSSSAALTRCDDFVNGIRQQLAAFDRVVVADQQMADLFADAHADIVILPTCLPDHLWISQNGQRICHPKPRIGFAAALCRGAAAKLIEALAGAFSDRVEWVVYGKCPSALLPHVSQICQETDTGIYHRELALQHLDLALVPHDGHPLTHSLACMHLLEYGATGIPVIHSSTLGFEHQMSATSVANQFSLWRDAIAMHLADPDASAKAGLALQRDVRQHSVMSQEKLMRVAAAWLK